MLFALVPIQSLNLYGNSASYFCDPYKNDITKVAIGTHGLISPFSLIFARMWAFVFTPSFPRSNVLRVLRSGCASCVVQSARCKEGCAGKLGTEKHLTEAFQFTWN
jgi:hypothetical protein